MVLVKNVFSGSLPFNENYASAGTGFSRNAAAVNSQGREPLVNGFTI
jgi:hypothetical protein